MLFWLASQSSDRVSQTSGMVHRPALLRNLDALQPFGEALRDVLLKEALRADAAVDIAPS